MLVNGLTMWCCKTYFQRCSQKKTYVGACRQTPKRIPKNSKCYWGKPTEKPIVNILRNQIEVSCCTSNEESYFFFEFLKTEF